MKTSIPLLLVLFFLAYAQPTNAVKKLAPKILRIKELLSSMLDRTKQTIEHLESSAAELPVCISFKYDQGQDYPSKTPITHHLYMAKLKKIFEVLLQSQSAAAHQKTKVLIIRDIVLGNRLQKEIEAYTGAQITKKITKDVHNIKVVQIDCRQDGQPMRLRLSQILLKLYRALRKSSKLMLDKRFVTEFNEKN